MSESKKSRFNRVKVESKKFMIQTGTESPVFRIQSDIIYQPTKNGNDMPKLTVVIVEENDSYDYVEGEVLVFIPTAVVVSKLNDLFPNSSYVGQCFTITQLPKQKGAKFFDVELNHCQE